MNWYVEKTIEMYKRGGIISVLLSGIKYTFLKSSKLLLKLSNEIPTTIYQSKFVEKNNIFKDIHKNRRCFIIGNGPSLRKHNLSFLNDEITFVLNAFWKHPIIKELQPNYYCIADPLFFDGSDAMNNFFHKITLKVSNSLFFIPYYSKKIIEEKNLLPIDKVFFISFRNDLCTKVPTKIDLTGYLPAVINVAELAIMTAIYMGCTPIYLVGFDHDWLSHRSKDRHFYTEKTVDNHKKASGTFKNISYMVTIKAVLKLWQGYENLSRYSSKKGINILNASKGGFLDVFERVNYESIFSQNNKKGD